MRWEPLDQASESLNYSKNGLRSKGGRKGWPRRQDRRNDSDSDNNNRYLYAVPESEAEARAVGVDKWDGGGRFAVDEDGEAKVSEPAHGPYYFDETRDRYIFNLPSKPRTPWVVPGEEVRTLVAAYSKDGDDATINQLCRQLGWHRKTVKETLAALGKTHDSLPFTDEQIIGTDEDELVEDFARREEERVHVRAERQDWAKVKDLADRARRWDKFIAETMSKMVVPPAPPIPRWKRDRKRRGTLTGNNLTVVSHATDLHFGKEGWVNQIGEEFTREICRDRLLDATEKLIQRIDVWGKPDEVILGVGGDWFHIDGHQGTTTKGTPQDADGNYLRIFTEGCALARDHIEMWRQHIPKVRVVAVRGNHDYYSTALLVHWLQGKYDGCEDVEIGRCEVDREYIHIGQTILGMTHGHSVKDKDLVSLMAAEVPELWGKTKHRLWLTGHWHSQIVTEHHGVVVEHLPSLAGSDRWHHEHGYVGNRKALMAHLIDHNEGPFAKLLVDKE
jgi:predicted phosphodiesterase